MTFAASMASSHMALEAMQDELLRGTMEGFTPMEKSERLVRHPPAVRRMVKCAALVAWAGLTFTFNTGCKLREQGREYGKLAK